MFTTDRLLLRNWRPEDRDPFAALNADPVVMEHFPATLTRDESDALVERIEDALVVNRFGLWALELRATRRFIGFTGLSVPRFDAFFTPAVEVGWRLARDAWGRGYASEAAREALRIGFDDLGLPEIVSFTSVGNTRSRAVMERIGMTFDREFDHPALAEGDPLRRHVLYRISASGRPGGGAPTR